MIMDLVIVEDALISLVHIIFVLRRISSLTGLTLSCQHEKCERYQILPKCRRVRLFHSACLLCDQITTILVVTLSYEKFGRRINCIDCRR